MSVMLSDRVRSGMRGRRRIRRVGSPVIQCWVRHQAAAEWSASRRALAVALAEATQCRANHRPIRSAAASSSSNLTGVSAPSSVTRARSARA